MPSELGLWLELGALGTAFVVVVIALVMKRVRRPLEPSSDFAGTSPPPLPASAAAPFDRVPTGWVRGFDFLVVALVVCLYLWPAALTLLGKTADEPIKLELASILGTMVMQVFFSAMIIGLVVWRIRLNAWLGLTWPGRSGAQWGIWLISVPACIGATWMLLGLLYVTGFIPWLQEVEGGDGQQEVVRAFQEINDPLTLAMLVLMAAVVAPVTEELIFRGYIYPVAKSRIGRTAAVIVTSLVFAAVHHNSLAMLPLTFLAVLLALSYEFRGSIWMPMSIHAAFNSLTVLGQLMVKFGYVQQPPGS